MYAFQYKGPVKEPGLPVRNANSWVPPGLIQVRVRSLPREGISHPMTLVPNHATDVRNRWQGEKGGDEYSSDKSVGGRVRKTREKPTCVHGGSRSGQNTANSDVSDSQGNGSHSFPFCYFKMLLRGLALIPWTLKSVKSKTSQKRQEWGFLHLLTSAPQCPDSLSPLLQQLREGGDSSASTSKDW